MKGLLLWTVLFTSVVKAQDSVSVLFIGNSYTYVNDLPGMLNSLTYSLGDEITYDSQTAGGATFQTHAGNSTTYTKIHAKPWDYVVLQAQSQEPSFPDDQVNTQTLPYAEQLADSIYANKFCSEVLFFMTWGRQDGDPQWEPISTFEGMNARLRDAYMRFSDSVQGSVTPVGSAWKYVRDNYPAINLYSADGSHPSVAGTYLAACTFYASLFRKSPIGSPFISTLDATTAGYLQNAAEIAVLDSLDQWHLRPIGEHTQADFTYSQNDNSVQFTDASWKANSWHWDFGDGNTSTDENPMYIYTVDGTFDVELIAESPCDTDTMTYSVTISFNGIDELNSSNIMIKNQGNGKYEFGNVHSGRLEVINMEGRLLISKEIEGEHTEIDLSENENGVYLVRFISETGLSVIRINR